MSSASTKLFSGDLPRYFPFGAALSLSTTTNQSSLPLFKESPYSTFQAILSSTIGNAITGTVTLQVSDDPLTGSGMVIGGINTTASSTTITSSTRNFAGGVAQFPALSNVAVSVGMLVVGANIPAGTVVQTVTNAGSLVLSAAATSTLVETALTFYNLNWCSTAMGVITLSGTTAQATPTFTDGFTTQASWRYVRAVVSAITGTGATVQCLIGN